jgi:predicted ATPase
MVLSTKENLSKLTGIYIENFQSIKDGVFIRLDGLVFIVGPNSAGKSSLIDALSIIRMAVGKNETKYVPGYWLNENRNYNLRGLPTIGVEIEVGKTAGGLGYTNEKARQLTAWRDSDNTAVDFFKSISGKRIQVDFSDEFETVRVAIDSVPLLEIIEKSEVLYNNFDKKCNTAEQDSGEFEDNYIYGKLVIYKNNLDAASLFYSCLRLSADERYKDEYYSSEYIDSYHYPLFVEESSDTFTIYGVNFNVSRVHDDNLVHLGYFADSILLNRRFAKDFPLNRRKQNAHQRYLYDMFHEESECYKKNRNSRANLLSRLEMAANEVNEFMEGLFFYLADAIETSHVKGDRTILSSGLPAYVSPFISETFDCVQVDENIAEYAYELAHKFPHSGFNKLNLLHAFDFVNFAFRRYLHSLKSYQVVPTVYQVKEKKSQRGKIRPDLDEIIFLKLKDVKDNYLGFEDVGSGISFVLPILTALWNSHFTIIEQPELHLHPRAQCELGDVLIAAKNGGSNSLIETHSEHLILRVLRRIREKTEGINISKNIYIENSEVNIYYFEPLDSGFTRVKKIRIDKFGELLDIWPGGFFSEREGELF